MEKKVTDFRHYYYYQESWAQTNKTSIYLGSYDFLTSSPQFLSKEYLEGDFDTQQFAQENLQVIEYLNYCQQKVPENPKRRFLYYCLFSE